MKPETSDNYLSPPYLLPEKHFGPPAIFIFDSFSFKILVYTHSTSKTLTIFKGTKDEQEATISVTKLSHELIDDKTDIPVSDEAESLDEDIYFYLEEKEINLPDDDIIAIVEQA